MIIDTAVPMEHTIQLYAKPDRLESILALWEYLCKNGYLHAPASSRADYHNAYSGGLFDHSCGVVEHLFALHEAGFGSLYTKESLFLVGLFHDAGKVCDGFGRTNYVPNTLASGNVSAAKPYKHNKEIVSLSSAYKSVLLVSRFVDLYEDEMQAIAHHDYLWVPEGRLLAVSAVCPLTLMLHFADMWAGVYKEPSKSLLHTLPDRNLVKFCKS